MQIEKFVFGGILETNAPKLINASLSPFSTGSGGFQEDVTELLKQ